MKYVKIWAIRVILPLLLLGIPFLALGGPARLSGDADAVSSASYIDFDKEDLDGSYVVLINQAQRSSSDTAGIWYDFFHGEEIPVVMEDIHCLVAAEDAPAKEYAEICQARLPENQMTIETENGLLSVSKALHGQYDIFLMSKAFADQHEIADLLEQENNLEVEVQ